MNFCNTGKMFSSSKCGFWKCFQVNSYSQGTHFINFMAVDVGGKINTQIILTTVILCCLKHYLPFHSSVKKCCGKKAPNNFPNKNTSLLSPLSKEKHQPNNPKTAMWFLALPPTCCSFRKVLFKRNCIQIFCFFQKCVKHININACPTSVNALKTSLFGPTIKKLGIM